MKRNFKTNYGDVSVRDIIIDLDGTNLTDGVEITSTDCDIMFEAGGYSAIDMTTEKLEHLIEGELS